MTVQSAARDLISTSATDTLCREGTPSRVRRFLQDPSSRHRDQGFDQVVGMCVCVFLSLMLSVCVRACARARDCGCACMCVCVDGWQRRVFQLLLGPKSEVRPIRHSPSEGDALK